MDTAIEQLLSFWFGALSPDGLAAAETAKRWWSSDAQFDQQIRQQFGHLLDQAETCQLQAWLESSTGCLAYIILLDQFSRNIYRGSQRAFANDAQARNATHHALQQQFLESLGVAQQAFMLMPLMHSEALPDHKLLDAELNRRYARATSTEISGFWSGMIRAATEHREIIERFGRYPHRNAVLKRPTTVGENEYLAAGGRRFGQ